MRQYIGRWWKSESESESKEAKLLRSKGQALLKNPDLNELQLQMVTRIITKGEQFLKINPISLSPGDVTNTQKVRVIQDFTRDIYLCFENYSNSELLCDFAREVLEITEATDWYNKLWLDDEDSRPDFSR